MKWLKGDNIKKETVIKNSKNTKTHKMQMIYLKASTWTCSSPHSGSECSNDVHK